MTETDKRNSAQEVAQKVIAGLKDGTAPFIKPWEAGTLQRPHNPLSGTVYRGANWATLMMQDREDPRWATYKQAHEAGWQVKEGEKGTRISFFTATRKVKKLDKDGKQVLDKNGIAVEELVKLPKPIIWHATVFNAEQMQNAPALLQSERVWNEVDRLEKLLSKSEAKIVHDQVDRAFYSSQKDSIHMPAKAQFPKQEYYYETVLHELAHWTGHETRLSRDLNNPFGSPEYAREELRAELASFMLAQETGLSHGLGRTTTYVQSWIQVLEEDPNEIILAAKDAEQISQFVLSFEKEREQLKEISSNLQDSLTPVAPTPIYTSLETMRIKVPYAEKEEFKSIMKQHGVKAIWDSKDKEWRVPSSVPKEVLSKWLTPTKQATLEENIADFTQRLQVAGLAVSSDMISADATIQRVPVDGGKRGAKDGAFALYSNSDGSIAGWFTNFKTGERGTWSAAGNILSTQQRADFADTQAQAAQVLRAEIAERHIDVAKQVQTELATLELATENHPYLVAKDITPINVFQSTDGKLILPLRDSDGQIWSTQSITTDGTKRYKKGGKKQGLYVNASETEPENGQPIVLAEGYATARTAVMATTATTLACLDVYNLEAVALDIKAKYPNSPILIIGDDDAEKALNTGINIGRETALKVADAVDGLAIFPKFSVGTGRERTDFNDLAREEGLVTVADQINDGLNRITIVNQKEVAYGR